MQDPAHADTIDVFIGVDIGKGGHDAVALDRSGKRFFLDCALLTGEAPLKALIYDLLDGRGGALAITSRTTRTACSPARYRGFLTTFLCTPHCSPYLVRPAQCARKVNHKLYDGPLADRYAFELNKTPHTIFMTYRTSRLYGLNSKIAAPSPAHLSHDMNTSASAMSGFKPEFYSAVVGDGKSVCKTLDSCSVGPRFFSRQSLPLERLLDWRSALAGARHMTEDIFEFSF